MDGEMVRSVTGWLVWRMDGLLEGLMIGWIYGCVIWWMSRYLVGLLGWLMNIVKVGGRLNLWLSRWIDGWCMAELIVGLIEWMLGGWLEKQICI